MFLGHFAVALGVKRAVPQVRLGTAVLAAAFLDILWPLFVAWGIEIVAIDANATVVVPFDFVSYPWSHSLFMALVWGVLFAAVHWWTGGSPRAALWLGGLVVSHWFLDLIVHVPDLPLLPGLGLYVGLGLWNSLAATLLVEGVLFAAGLWLYLSATRPRDRTGVWAVWGFVALLLVSYAGTSAQMPPGIAAVVVAGLVGAAISVIWGYWIDRHRTPAAQP